MSARPPLLALVLLAFLGAAQAQEIVFASRDEARRILSTSDAYFRAMSDFDRSARLSTDRVVSESDFLAFAGAAALEWKADEREAVEAALKDVMPNVRRLRLPLPPRIYMIKTSGAEDAHAAYTRQNAIVLPSARLADRGAALRKLVAHELFHVATRAHPKLGDALYRVIGFHSCDVVLPAMIRSRRITNPDAPKDEHCIEVEVDNRKVWALPVLLSTASKEDFARGAVFLERMIVALLLIDKAPGAKTARALEKNGSPQIVPPHAASGFFESIGRNTQYILHPEEIVAENFALLAIGVRDVPSPEILAAIEKVLKEYAGFSSGSPASPRP